MSAYRNPQGALFAKWMQSRAHSGTRPDKTASSLAQCPLFRYNAADDDSDEEEEDDEEEALKDDDREPAQEAAPRRKLRSGNAGGRGDDDDDDSRTFGADDQARRDFAGITNAHNSQLAVGYPHAGPVEEERVGGVEAKGARGSRIMVSLWPCGVVLASVRRYP